MNMLATVSTNKGTIYVDKTVIIPCTCFCNHSDHNQIMRTFVKVSF